MNKIIRDFPQFEGKFQGTTERRGTAHISSNTEAYIRFIYMKQAVPLQAWTGPEGSRRLRLPDFKTIGT